jgi:tetratricopeptide (TPR) repeat protein
MELCGDDDEDLKQLSKDMKKTTKPNFRTLGDVLKDMGQFDLAEKYLHRSLDETPLNYSSLGYVFVSLSEVAKGKGDNDGYISWAEKARDAFGQFGPSDDLGKAKFQNLAGEIHRRKGDYNQALKCYYKGLLFFRKANADNNRSKAKLYENISLVYQAQGRYTEALYIEDELFVFRQKILPSAHRDLALSYDSIGLIHRYLGHNNVALKNFEHSLRIKEKSLPSHHPEIGRSNQYISSCARVKEQIATSSDMLAENINFTPVEGANNPRNIVSMEKDIENI